MVGGRMVQAKNAPMKKSTMLMGTTRSSGLRSWGRKPGRMNPQS